MPNKIKWGIIGPGKIATKFATDLATLPDAELYAVASRNLEKAQTFAKTLGFQKAFGSYEAMLQDPDLEVVYVATPHVFHYQNTRLCLQHKKAVLCEKPLSINAKEVKEMLAIAKANDVFLMDALWTLCLPHILKTKAIVESGQLGKLVSVKADFGFNATFDPNGRLFDRDLGGGSLLDIGIYPAMLALLLLGKPKKITAAAHLGSTKVDEDCAVFLDYGNGQTANLHSTLVARTPTEAYIYCEKGYIYIPTQFHKPVEQITILRYENLEREHLHFEKTTIGYSYEAAEVMRCLQVGKNESDLVSHQFSLDLMELLDEIRVQIGLVYPRHD
ncbi:MAG: Gfo/Idh/MocA family oxidoreductase [Bacteroidota bacterium]